MFDAYNINKRDAHLSRILLAFAFYLSTVSQPSAFHIAEHTSGVVKKGSVGVHCPQYHIFAVCLWKALLVFSQYNSPNISGVVFIFALSCFGFVTLPEMLNNISLGLTLGGWPERAGKNREMWKSCLAIMDNIMRTSLRWFVAACGSLGNARAVQPRQ